MEQAGHDDRARLPSPLGPVPTLNIGRRLAANTLANWSGLAFGTLASLVLAPYLIDHLSAERFGLYQISRQFVIYFSLFELGMLGSVMRHSAQAIAARDGLEVSRVVSNGVALYSLIALIGLSVSALVGQHAPDFFRVAPENAPETRWLFWALGLSWSIEILTAPARSIVIGHQRFGWLNLIVSSGWVLTVALIVILFEFGWVSLAAVGTAFCTVAVFRSASFLVLVRHLQPDLRWNASLVGRSMLKKLSGFGAWNLLFVGAGLLLWSSDNIVIGRLLGAEMVPFYALPFMLITHGRFIINGLSAPLTPASVGLARHDPDGLRTTFVRSTRTAVILTLAGSGILIVVAADLFRLWIGPAYTSSWLVYACLMGSFWAVLAHLPGYNILLGVGDIRGPASAIFAAAALTLILKIVVVTQFGFGVVGVALANCVLILPVMLYYIPRCACKMVGLPLGKLYREAYLPPFLPYVPVAAGGWVVFAHWSPANLLELIAAFLMLTLLYLALAVFTLDGGERAVVWQVLQRFLSHASVRRRSR